MNGFSSTQAYSMKYIVLGVASSLLRFSIPTEDAPGSSVLALHGSYHELSPQLTSHCNGLPTLGYCNQLVVHPFTGHLYTNRVT